MVEGTGCTPDREADVARIIAAVERWAGTRVDIRAVAVVGSWARGTATAASDIDIVLLTNDPADYLTSTGWWDFLGSAQLVATKRWGELTERRIALPSGLEIEFGIVAPSWAGVDPLDLGTVRVVRDGLHIVRDPDKLLRRLVEAAKVTDNDG